MSCGFGAVVLVFLIIDHSLELEAKTLNIDLLSEIDLLEQDIRDGTESLVGIKNTLDTINLEVVTAEGEAERIQEEMIELERLIAELNEDNKGQDSLIEQLKAELSDLEQEVEKLRTDEAENAGRSARDYAGDGNRQYLTGLNLGGKHIAILLDSSASMLDQRIVNVIRLRNMSPEIQAQSPKWRRSANTVRWLSAQLPPSAKYQVITFNESAESVLAETKNQWMDVSNQTQLEQVGESVSKLLPSGGSNLYAAFDALSKLTPQPDNIFLITDGLPTQGKAVPRTTTVTSREREALFREAVKILPRSVPVNTILAPMEGDPLAAAYFWQLAQSTQGSFISPSEDWP